MLEIKLRKFHRYLGVGIAPLALLQVVSGLFLSVDLLWAWQNDLIVFLNDHDMPAVAAFWEELFLEIHYGSGNLGFIHTLLVALGFLGLILSGVLIFIKILVRSSLAKTPKKPADEQSEQARADIADTSPRRRVGVALVLAALGLVSLDIYMFATAYRLIGLHAPHLYATQQMQSNISRSRTALERLMAGDSTEPAATVRYGLNRASMMAKVLLERDELSDYVVTGVQREILPIESKAQRRSVVEIDNALDRLLEKAQEPDLARRLRAEEATDTNSFLRSIELLDSSAEALAEGMMDELEKDKERLFFVHLVLFSLAFIFLVAVGALIHFYDAGRQRYLQKIEAAREIAHAYQRRFREVIRQSADPMLVFDRGGNIISASLTASHLLGYTEEELLKQNISNIDNQADGSEWVTETWRDIAPGGSVSIKSVWRHYNGELSPVVLSVSLVDGDKDGGAPLMLALARLETTHK